jgi:hypothetical protein
MRNLGKMTDIREVKTRDIVRLWVKNPVSKTMDSEDLCPTKLTSVSCMSSFYGYLPRPFE